MSFCTDRIPDHMLWEGKPIDNNFEGKEKLFIRCLSDFIDQETGKFIATGFPSFPGTSTNRGKYCIEPEDVLVPIYLDWGIAYFKVENITLTYIFRSASEYLIRPIHVPLPANYPHSEMHVFEKESSETELAELKPNALEKAITKFFRGELTKNAEVHKSAELSLAEWRKVKEARFARMKEIEDSIVAS